MRRMVLCLMIGLAVLALGRRLRTAADETLRVAGEALKRGDDGKAVDCYRQAIEQGVDPVRVAHNLGGALYRLEQYKDADQQYCSSAQPGGLAAARAAYDRGNCLLHEACPAQQPRRTELLAQAIQQYEQCLACERPDPGAGSLFENARHNLELARLLQAPDEQYASAHSRANPDPPGNPSEGPHEAEDQCPS